MTDRRHDVAIVGGGLIGASLACALKSTDLDVAVIEAVPFRSEVQPSYDEKLLTLAPASKRILDGIGVWSAIEPRGVTPIEHIHISDRGHWGKARLAAEDFGVPALGYTVPARVIGLGVIQRIQDTDAATLYCPARVVGIKPDADGVSISVATEDSSIELRSRLLVLADGGTKETRDMLGIEIEAKDYGQTAIVCTVTPESPLPNTAFERFTSTGPLAVLPAVDRRCTVVWTAGNEEVERILGYLDDEFTEELQSRFGDWLGRLTAPGRRRSYPLRLMRVRTPVRGRALVVGNAAHTIHPVAGQGFNLGLRDVAALAEVLATHFGVDPDIGRPGVLKVYKEWRQQDTRQTTRFTDGLIRVFANDLPPMMVGRNIALTLLNHCPPAKRYLVKRTMGLNGKLPRLVRGLPAF